MKLALRDLFWAVLIAAIGVAWGLEHFKFATAIRNANRSHGFWAHRSDTEETARLKKFQEHLKSLSNTELIKELEEKQAVPVPQFTRPFNAEPYWLEMSQRRMAEKLREIYEQQKDSH